MTKISSIFLLLLCIGAPLVLLTSAARIKRQAQPNRNNNNGNQFGVLPPGGKLDATASAAAAMSSSTDGELVVPNVGVNNRDRPLSGRPRPIRPQSVATLPTLESDEDLQPTAKPPRKQKPQVNNNRRPASSNYNYYDDVDGGNNHEDADDDGYNHEDCDDYDYGNMFHHMASKPMRHITHMMGNMFDQMQGMASSNFASFPDGANYAVASARNDGDGYSRMSSLINNNGRTRGIVSETRNGRTQTRRIGNDRDDSAE